MMAGDCQHSGDCPSEFLRRVEQMDPTILLIQFAFFFFIPAACGVCLPEVISQVVSGVTITRSINFIEVLSPPPRFSAC